MMSDPPENINKEMEIIKKNQIEFPELKSTIAKKKVSELENRIDIDYVI